MHFVIIPGIIVQVVTLKRLVIFGFILNIVFDIKSPNFFSNKISKTKRKEGI